MALIAMAVYCTEENQKDEKLSQVINALEDTIQLFDKNRICFVVNGHTKKTKRILEAVDLCGPHMVIYNNENVGTARAINQAWSKRKPGENCIKMDDDIVINQSGWIEEMEAAIEADPLIGQVGLKRKDCWEYPGHEHEDWRSELKMLPHVPGHPWIVVEKVKHVIGSCVMHSAALLDKVGGLYQPGLYGYDDVIMSHRSYLAGFYSCFLPHINIDHIDDGKTSFQSWKEKHSGQYTDEVIQLVHAMIRGEKSIYYPFE